jgi:hypothetical protein
VPDDNTSSSLSPSSFSPRGGFYFF